MSAITETLDLVKKAQASPSDEIIKSWLQAGGSRSDSMGLVGYDLEAPAKTLYPVLTPLRNLIPRVKGAGDVATRWKAITGINTGEVHPGVGEGNRGGVIATATANYTAPYIGLGLEDFVTFEADYAAQGFDDVKARAVQGLLRALMIQEERLLWGGNGDVALGTTPTPTAANSASGGTIPAGTYNVICVALTHQGYRRSSVAGGVVGQISKTNADGSVDTIPGGAAQKSAAASAGTTTGSTSSITASVAAVAGAVAYAWFVGTAASERLVAITTTNSVLVTALNGSGQLASALTAADYSNQSGFAFSGLLYSAFKSGSNATIVTQATGTAGTGTGLTTDNKGGIVEFDALLGAMWDNYKLSPKRIWCARQELVNLSKKVVGTSTPMFRFNVENGVAQGGMVGGTIVRSYLNPVTNQELPIAVHPDATPGTILFETDELPYQLSGVQNVYQVKTRREYYQLEWPLKSRKYEYGVYADELFQHYFTPALGVITNIGNA